MIGKYDTEYYLPKETGPAASFMLREREDSGVSNAKHGSILASLHSVKNKITDLGRIEIHQGDETKFVPCDFHMLPDELISESFKRLLQEFELPNLDFYESEIITKSKVYKNYFLMHLYNELNVIHPDRSVYKGEIESFNVKLKKLSLNESVLDEIELKDRSMFFLEGCARIVVHESIVKAVMDTDLTGIGFTRVDKWNIGSMFD